MSKPVEFRSGPLSQLAGAVYRHMALGICLVLGCLPTVAIVTLLASSPGNAPFFVLAQVFVAPALSAGLYAVRGWRRDAEASPSSLFWTGYRLNALDVLRWCVPALLVAAVLSVNVAYAESVAGGAILRPVTLVLGLALTLWAGHALVISSFFSFRTRDLARIATVELFGRWRVTLTFLSMLIVAAGVTYLGNEVGVALLAWAFVSPLEFIARPVVVNVTQRFTTDVPE